MSATNLRSLYLMQHSPQFFFLSFFYSQVWELLDQGEAPSPSQADQWYTCEPKLLQLACRSLCIPSYRRCSLSIGKYHGNSRAGLPHRCGRRGTAPAELWDASDNSVAPKTEKWLHDQCRELWTRFGDLKNACCRLITPAPSCQSCQQFV